MLSNEERIIELLERIAEAVEAQVPKRRRQKSIRFKEQAGDQKDNFELVVSFVKCWNENCGDRMASSSVPAPGTPRWTAILECLKEQPDISRWASAVSALSKSAFHTGDNQRGWRANIDFIVSAGQRAKWLEEGQFKKARDDAMSAASRPASFCCICSKPAVVGPGTRAPDLSDKPKCSAHAGVK